MAANSTLMDAVARFTNADVDAFRSEWNAQSAPAETPEKQKLFQAALSQTNGKNLLAGGISVRVHLKYTSLSGETKDREVILRRIFKNGKEIFVDALCLDINAPRLIKFDSILQVIDEKTKTLYTKPEDFFENVLGIDLNPIKEKTGTQAAAPAFVPPTYTLPSNMKNGELKTAVDMTRHEITALLFVSGMGGNRDLRELQTVVEYVHRRCPNLNFSDADLMNYLQMNYPDSQSFYFALERILGKEGWVVKMFLEKLMALIVANGKTDEKEKLFLADFLRILEEEGFQLNFKQAAL